MNRPFLIVGFAGLALAVGAPVAGTWLRHPADHRCHFDWAPIEPVYEVRVVDERGAAHPFCCLRCAELWLENEGGRPRAVYVTDEATGGEIDAASAHFVRSVVVTTHTSGNRVHVFVTRAAAEEHAEHFGGRLLEGADRPFPNLR